MPGSPRRSGGSPLAQHAGGATRREVRGTTLPRTRVDKAKDGPFGGYVASPKKRRLPTAPIGGRQMSRARAKERAPLHERTVFDREDTGHLGARGRPDGLLGLDRVPAAGARRRVGSPRVRRHEA